VVSDILLLFVAALMLCARLIEHQCSCQHHRLTVAPVFNETFKESIAAALAVTVALLPMQLSLFAT